MLKVQILNISEAHAGQRIDNFLLTLLKGVPKSRIYRMIRKGEVRVNKGRVKPDYKLCLKDKVRVPPIQMTATEVPVVEEGLKMRVLASILYEDQDLIVVNKPSGLAVHGGSGIRLGLIEALREAMPQQPFLELVHRLDKDTSGCIMLAKKRAMLTFLHEALRQNRVEKNYLALVVGKWPNRRNRVRRALQKNTLRSGERIVIAAPEGKPAETEFSIIERFKSHTLVRAKPITGRTHQIRVHCQMAGYPIGGDEKYGRDADNATLKRLGLNRLFLHAHSLSIPMRRRDDSYFRIEAPLDKPLQNLLGTLKREFTND